MFGPISTDQLSAAERLGYPTQKPEALLERIIKASSNEGDVVLDPFCGCGTAIAVAQRLNRNWIGIDITYLAISLMKHRLHDGLSAKRSRKPTKWSASRFDLPMPPRWQPKTRISSNGGRWDLVNARPVEQKKGADKGIDGRIFFHDEAESRQDQANRHLGEGREDQVPPTSETCAAWSSGKTPRSDVLIAMEEPTAQHAQGSRQRRVLRVVAWNTKHPKIQILTVEELLEGKKIDIPPTRDIRTFKNAPKAKRKPKRGGGSMLLF